MRNAAVLFLMAMILVLCGGVQAATPQPAGTAEVQQLRSAYRTLEVADHDYHGHRIKAMHALHRACKLLGSEIRGDGKGHQSQPVSDAELTQAQTTIHGVLQGNVVAGQPKVAKLLEKAVEEISLALKVR